MQLQQQLGEAERAEEAFESALGNTKDRAGLQAAGEPEERDEEAGERYSRRNL